MIANILNALGGSANSMAASFLKPELEKHLSGIGTVEELQIDLQNKRVSATIAMNGDPKPLKIRIDRFELAPSGSGSILKVLDYSCPSHEWIAQLGKKFSPTFEIPLPVPYAMLGAIF